MCLGVNIRKDLASLDENKFIKRNISMCKAKKIEHISQGCYNFFNIEFYTLILK